MIKESATPLICAALVLSTVVAATGGTLYYRQTELDRHERAVCAGVGMKLLRLRDLPWGHPSRYCIEPSGQAWSFETFGGAR